MQSACHALSTQCHGEEYAYLAMSGTMDTCKYHGMSCQAGPAKRSISAHTPACIFYRSASLHLLELLESAAAHYPFAQNKQLITSLTLLTTVCARTDCNALNMISCHRRTAPRDRDKHAYITYTPDTQYIHCKHYIHNAVNEITRS